MPLANMCITTPFVFPLRLSPWRMLAVSRIRNPWDRDLALKESLGLAEQMLSDAGNILRVKDVPVIS
jgi:hypothetical protein